MHGVGQGRRTAGGAETADHGGDLAIGRAAAAQFSGHMGAEEALGLQPGVVVGDETVVGVVPRSVFGQLTAQGVGPGEPVDPGRFKRGYRGNGHREHPCLIRLWTAV